MDEELHAAGMKLRAAAAATMVTSLPKLEPLVVASLRDKLESRHHLAGAFLDHAEHAVVGFQLAHGNVTFPIKGLRSIVPWCWNDTMSAGFSLSAFADDHYVARAWLDYGAAELALLQKRRFVAAFFSGSRFVGAFDVDLSADSCAAHLDEQLAAMVRPATALNLAVPHYWDMLGEGTWAHTFTLRDRASIAWSRAFRARLRIAINDVSEALPRIEPAQTARFPSPIREFLQIASTAPEAFSAALPFLDEEFVRDKCQAFLQALMRSQGLENVAPQHDLLRPLLLQFMDGPTATECGTRLSGVSSTGTIEQLPLDLAHIEREVGIDEYWHRVPPKLRLKWTEVLTGRDIPASWAAITEGLLPINTVDDVAASSTLADALLEEAVTHRQWSIPRKARVEFLVGPFVAAEFHEIYKDVLAVLRLKDGSFHVAEIEPEATHRDIHLPLDPERAEEHVADRIEATLAVLVCSIIRDFWVTEDRAAVFARKVVRPTTKKSSGARDHNEGPVVVYLPRIRYTSVPSPKTYEPDPQRRQRAHTVSGHLRRVGRASAQQLFIAQVQGIVVPEGFTFVRAHRRGETERAREVIYRSRSALRSLYELQERTSDELPDELDWFKFDAQVARVLEARGIEIERLERMPTGTGTRLFGTAAEQAYLIHARLQHRLGPTHLDALVGERKAPCRAILITNGEVSTPLNETARAADIEILQLRPVRS